jgi:predicted unusual protein kinase regulating ubiquinone biosynthesis (AarF/ABC1/UbiB family)
LRRARRTWQVVCVLTRWFLVPALPLRRRPVESGAERTRAALEQLGGAWIKLGQMLALRFELLPAAYCEELLKLLNAVQPFPYSGVCDIVRQELGGQPDVVFQTFEPVPFASASIGQVHRATLRTGEHVAVICLASAAKLSHATPSPRPPRVPWTVVARYQAARTKTSG